MSTQIGTVSKDHRQESSGNWQGQRGAGHRAATQWLILRQGEGACKFAYYLLQKRNGCRQFVGAPIGDHPRIFLRSIVLLLINIVAIPLSTLPVGKPYR